MIIELKSAEPVIRQLEERRRKSTAEAFAVADEMIRGVRERGDAFVAEQIARFDKVKIGADQIVLTLDDGQSCLSPLKDAIETAIERIRSFHLAQLPRSYEWQRSDTRIEHRVRPLQRVGIYVPGGRAVYLSTLIMCAVPARIAGVREIVVATTPAAAARDEFQYACSVLGISQVYRSGGAAGIAAMALGTSTLARVDKIVGPGNSYVTAAKARLIGEVGIDMTAGPTELIVIADDSADVDLVAADLAAQAEHGPDSAVICVATDRMTARKIDTTGAAQFVFIGDEDEAIAFANRIAPEHLCIQTRNPAKIAASAENCGAIYVGRASAPAAGDYIFGSNHVLPTAGSARFFSPLGVYDFVKRSNVVFAGERDLETVITPARTLAEFEGLPRHAASITARTEVKTS